MWVIVILGFLLFPPLQADNNGNCQIENIKSAEWAVVFQPTKTVYDNEADVEIFKSPFTGKVENLKCTCLACKHEYVNFEANDSIFLISTTNFITELDSDTVKTTSSSVELNYVCNMNCNNDKPSKLSVLIKINDYNNHPPEFLETSYKYTVPFPIMHQTDFTLNDVKIEAGDLDFSNQNMTFTITPNDFDIFTTVDNANSKKYIANFRANKNIQANGVREYKLIATDSGTYPSTSSSTVSVTIDVDGSSSLDVPSFIYPDSSTDAYSFNYESDGSLKPLTGDIKVQTDRTDPSTLKLSGEYSEHFEVSFEAATKIVTLSTKSKIENPTSSSSIITLHFKTDVEISAPIIINFSDVSMSSITFNKHVYTGSYTDKDTVKLDQDITVVTSETGLPEVTLLSGDFSKHFDIKYDESSKTCSISTKTPLTVEDIKSNSYIKLDLNVALDKYSDTSSLILKLPVYTLQFTDVLYLAQYTKDNKVNVAEDKPIAFTTETSGVKISVETAYETYFSVNDDYTINVKNSLPADTLSTNTEIAVILTANDKYENQPQAVLKIILPLEDTNRAPKFSQPFYQIQYGIDDSGFLDFADPIAFDNVVDPLTVKLSLNNYAEYFKPVIESGKWRLKILNRPDDTILNGNAELVTVMEARLSDSQPAGKAVLVIELVQKSPNQPAFKDVYYTAEYPKDGKGTINFDTDIIFNNVDDITAVSISISGYSNNFEVKYDNGASKWSINIKNPLDDTILSTQTYITTTLVANINGDSVHVPTSAFILKLPEHEIQEAPTFSKSYYKAEYSMKDSTPICTFTDEIGFSNDVDPTKITIAADEYSNKFTFKYDKDSKKWNVKVEEPLDVNILDRTDLVVSITASDTATKLQSHSVIDLKLPNVNTDGAPKFSKTYYKAKYEIADGTSTVTLLDPLDILNVDPDATISITTDTYTDNFAILKEHGEWVITVTKALDEEILNSHVDIVMGLIVTVKTNTDEIGQAALVLTLPLINNNEAPKFSSIFYSSETNQTTATLDRPIKIMNKPDLTKITVNILEDAYKKYFDVKYDETTQSWEIVVQSLPIDVMQDKNPLVLTLHAEEKENTNIGQASLVLNFPIMEAPTFSSNQYYGTYSEKNELTVESIGIPNKNNPDDIELKLVSSETDVTEYFKFTYDKTKHVWQIGLNKPFNDDITNGKSELVLTLSAIEKHNEKVGYATVIIQLSSSVNNGDLSFSEVLYEGDYDSTGDTPVVTLNHVIKLISKEDLSKATVNLKNSDDFDSNKYFKIEISSPGIYKLSVKESVTDDILQKQKSLAFTLEASLDSYKSYSSIILRVVENSIEFSKILYNGKYVVDDNSFTVEDIALITKEDSSKINVFISEDSAYAKYFGISQKDDVVTVKIEETIPSDLLKDIFVIPLTLIANSSTTSKSGTAVLIIDVQNGDDIVDNRKIAFESFIYNGKYTVENNVPTISTDTIKLDTNQGDENITTHIQSPYNTYFEVHYTNKVITIDLKSNVDNSNLRKKNNIPVVVVAEIIGSNHVATTVVNFEVVDKDNSEKHNGTISFPQLIYNGEYDIDVTTFKMITSVNVITDYTEDEIDIQLTNDAGYEKYFTWQYNHGTITISLKETLPKKEMEKLGFMALEITVSSKENNAVPAEAVLNVKIKRKTIATEMSQTGYIVAVSILAALLFLLIAGTIAFYFFKIRNSKYQKMSEEEYVNKVRFDKSSLKRDTSKRSSALDERRPTGFIFNSNNKVDEEVRDSSTDIPDMSAERKKSVAFDEHVEKLQIETVADDEVDKASIENKTDDSI